MGSKRRRTRATRRRRRQRDCGGGGLMESACARAGVDCARRAAAPAWQWCSRPASCRRPGRLGPASPRRCGEEESAERRDGSGKAQQADIVGLKARGGCGWARDLWPTTTTPPSPDAADASTTALRATSTYHPYARSYGVILPSQKLGEKIPRRTFSHSYRCKCRQISAFPRTKIYLGQITNFERHDVDLESTARERMENTSVQTRPKGISVVYISVSKARKDYEVRCMDGSYD
jgi:hypothetical protein